MQQVARARCSVGGPVHSDRQHAGFYCQRYTDTRQKHLTLNSQTCHTDKQTTCGTRLAEPTRPDPTGPDSLPVQKQQTSWCPRCHGPRWPRYISTLDRCAAAPPFAAPGATWPTSRPHDDYQAADSDDLRRWQSDYQLHEQLQLSFLLHSAPNHRGVINNFISSSSSAYSNDWWIESDNNDNNKHTCNNNNSHNDNLQVSETTSGMNIPLLNYFPSHFTQRLLVGLRSGDHAGCSLIHISPLDVPLVLSMEVIMHAFIVSPTIY